MTNSETDDQESPGFGEALRQALAQASEVEQANADFREEVAALADAVKSATDGRLTVFVYSGKRLTTMGQLTGAVKFDEEFTDPEDEPPEHQSILLAAVDRDPTDFGLTRELGRVLPSDGGYPFRIEGPEGTVFAEDKGGLHGAVFAMSRHPRTGLKLKGLMAQVGNTKRRKR